MEKIWPYLLIALIALVGGIVWQVLRGQVIKNLSEILYQKNDPDLYLKKLYGFPGNLFFSHKTKIMQSIDAYGIKGDNENVEHCFNEMEKMKLSFGKEVSLYEKETQFFIQSQQYDKAEKANDKLQELGKRLDNPNLKSICEESNDLIGVYAKRDGSLAKKMLKYADDQSQLFLKGIYYYRASKCFYYQNDKANTTKYLKEAQKKLVGSSWVKHIDNCLKDFKYLDEK